MIKKEKSGLSVSLFLLNKTHHASVWMGPELKSAWLTVTYVSVAENALTCHLLSERPF